MSKGGWSTIKASEIEKPKLGPHRWTTSKAFHWTYCDRCGIMITRNWGRVKSCNNCGQAFGKVCDG